MGLYYKILRIRNWRKMNKFGIKLESFIMSVTFIGLDKHTSLLQNTNITNP